MKYIEELNSGDIFITSNDIFVLTTDFRKNRSRLATSLLNGQQKWFDADSIVNTEQLYKLDSDNNISPIKEFKNEYTNTNKN